MLVSEPEKNADMSTKNAIAARRIQRGISLNLIHPYEDRRCEKYVQVI